MPLLGLWHLLAAAVAGRAAWLQSLPIPRQPMGGPPQHALCRAAHDTRFRQRPDSIGRNVLSHIKVPCEPVALEQGVTPQVKPRGELQSPRQISAQN